MSRGLCARAAALFVSLGLLAPAAHAHLGHPVVLGERLIRLDLSKDPPRLVYSLGLGTAAAAAERARADTNGDHEVSAREGNAALDALGRKLAAAVTVCTGRTLDAASCRPLRPADLEGSSAAPWQPESASQAMVLEWTFRLPIDPGDAAVRIEDAWDRPEVERTDVVIVPPSDHPLVRAGAVGATGVATELAWVDALLGGRPRSFVAAWAPPPRPVIVWSLAAGVALAALAALALRSRRRPPSA